MPAAAVPRCDAQRRAAVRGAARARSGVGAAATPSAASRRRQSVALRRRLRLSRRGADDDADGEPHRVRLRAGAGVRSPGGVLRGVAVHARGRAGHDAAGQTRITIGNDLYTYPPTRVILDACLEPLPDPRRDHARALAPGDSCPSHPAYVPSGVDVKLVVATGFPGVALSANAYDRLRGAGAADALLAGPLTTLHLVDPADEGPIGAGVQVATSTLGHARAAGDLGASPLALVSGKEPFFGPCASLARSRRIRRAYIASTPDDGSHPGHCSGELCCLIDESGPAARSCMGAGGDYNYQCGQSTNHSTICNDSSSDTPAAAVVELKTPHADLRHARRDAAAGRHQRRRAADASHRRRRHRHRGAAVARRHRRLSGQPLHCAVRPRRRLRRLSAAVVAVAVRLRLVQRAGAISSNVQTYRGCAHVHQRCEPAQAISHRGELLVARGRPAHVGALRRGGRAAGAARAQSGRARLFARVRVRADDDAGAARRRRGQAGGDGTLRRAGRTKPASRSFPRRSSGTCRARTTACPGSASGRSTPTKNCARGRRRWCAASSARCATSRTSPAGCLSNEMPLWAGAVGLASGAPADDVVAWGRAMTAVVRQADGTRPVGTGDGMMAGWPTRALADAVDWVGPHVYYGDVDPLRQAFNSDFVLARARALGRPVLLEEFGASSTQAGEAEHAAYVRESMLTSLAAGARRRAGLVRQRLRSPDARRRDALLAPRVRARLRHFARRRQREAGVRRIARAQGARRRHRFPVAGAAARARRHRLQRLGRGVVSVFVGGQGRAAPRAVAVVRAGGAGRARRRRPRRSRRSLDGYALVLVPSTQKLRVPTWHKLEAAARAGATVYWSYFSGDHEFHQGAWCPNFTALTGLRHRLRYGCFDLPGERLTLKGQAMLSVPTGQQHHAAPAVAGAPADLSLGRRARHRVARRRR